MTLSEISDRTSLTARQLRYGLEHRVFPGLEDASMGRGFERTFTDFEAFCIALVAMMFKAGLRRSVVRRCIEILCPDTRNMNANPLFVAFTATGETTLEVGDSVNLRLQGESIHRKRNLDTKWRQLSTGAILQAGYQPDVTVRIDVGKIRGRLRG